jgi:steroid 5-alpha reductase family enzyme
VADAELGAVAAVVAVLAVTYAFGRRVGRHSVIDVAWGVMFALIGVVSFVASAGEGHDARRWLLLLMPVVWGTRLAVHIGRRQRGKPEDPRYERLLRGHGPGFAALMVYGLQGALVLVIAQPVIVGSFTVGGLTQLAYVGVGLWLVGLFFETVGDWQLEQYRRDAQRGPVMDRGLWRYTRHPNYFGDACVWVGIFLVAAEQWPGVLTILSPAVMVYLLAFGSGKKVLERHMEGRPGFAAYQQRTSGFIPLPPRRV